MVLKIKKCDNFSYNVTETQWINKYIILKSNIPKIIDKIMNYRIPKRENRFRNGGI